MNIGVPRSFLIGKIYSSKSETKISFLRTSTKVEFLFKRQQKKWKKLYNGITLNKEMQHSTYN